MITGDKSLLPSSWRCAGHLSANASHEKAGRSQVGSFVFRWTRFFSRRVATDAILPSALSEERFVSLGARWAFSFQPVLPSDYRPVVLLLESRTWARPLTQSPELGFGFCLFSSWNDFDFVLPFCFTRLLRRCLAGYCAAVRTPLRSPTDDATTPPAFSRWQRSPVSSRFFHRARPASGPSA